MTHAPPSARPFAVSLLTALLATGLDALLLGIALGGAAPLLHRPRALVLLAIWANANVLLAVRQPARSESLLALEPDPLPVMIALFTLPFAAAPLAAWGTRAGIARLPGGALLGAAGLAIAALGLALRSAAVVQLGRRFSPQVAVQHGHELETGGLYARVRHPGYLGAMIAAIGGAMTFESALGLVPVVLLVPALMARVAREERLLEQRFGDSFRDWRERTGGLLPRLGPPR